MIHNVQAMLLIPNIFFHFTAYNMVRTPTLDSATMLFNLDKSCIPTDDTHTLFNLTKSIYLYSNR